jgi:hypothetical protein
VPLLQVQVKTSVDWCTVLVCHSCHLARNAFLEIAHLLALVRGCGREAQSVAIVLLVGAPIGCRIRVSSRVTHQSEIGVLN